MIDNKSIEIEIKLRSNNTMTSQDFLELIEEVREQVNHHADAVMLCRWAEIRAKTGYMTVKDYFTFKVKLGMGH